VSQAGPAVRDLARDTNVEYRMWSRPDYPTRGLPALDAATCVTLQGEALFEAMHRALYRAFFTDGLNIDRREEVIDVVGPVPGGGRRTLPPGLRVGSGPAGSAGDYEAVSRHGILVIPTVVAPDGRCVLGAVSLSEYRRVLGV
jgi:2-hydroxychromene-2-carboxylate isomerase